MIWWPLNKSALTDFTRDLSENNDHLSRKLTKEQRLKEELLAQADEEKKSSDAVLKQLQTLQTKSEEKIKYLEAELAKTTKWADNEILILRNENAQLISRGKETEQELQNYKVILSKTEEEVEENQFRFTELINKFKVYTNSFLDNFMNSDSNTHLNKPGNNKITSMLDRKESPHSSARGHMTRTMKNSQLDNTLQKQNLFSISLQAAKYKASTQSVNHTSEQHHNLTAEARQICVNNTEPSLTTRITPYYNLTSDNTEPSLTTRTTPYYNLTAEARQICVNNTEPTLTTRTMPHHNLTAEARQICVNNTDNQDHALLQLDRRSQTNLR
ncbi:hypothetical protein J6590_068004 [Homalodisca vitripennis]|nr:hypothetical protein J6590_068004 [Homalodisca vitripennis]